MPPKKSTSKTPRKRTGMDTAALNRFDERWEKNFGHRLVSADTLSPYETISTGSIALDYAMGVGGYVRGRVTEIWGQDSLGKTTMSFMGLREAQRALPDKPVAFIDMENRFDPRWAARQGIDLSRLRIEPTANAEDVADQMKEIIRSGLFSMVVLDSIGGMISEAEKTKEAGEAVVANVPKIVTRMVEIASSEAPKTGIAVVLLNQVRAIIGPMGGMTTPGGFGLRHATTHKLRLRRGEKAYQVQIGGENREVGHDLVIFTERNSVAPKRTAHVTLFTVSTSRYGPVGFDRADEALTMGLKTDVLKQRAGGYYTMPDGSEIRGRDSVLDALRELPDLVEDIRGRVLETIAAQVHDEVEEVDGSGNGHGLFPSGPPEDEE